VVSSRAPIPKLAQGRGLRIALTALALGLVATSAQAAPPCGVHSTLEPASAVVGQQVIHRIWIERSESVARIEWLQAPRFSGARAEQLPGRMEERVPSEGPLARWSRVEARALFPAHPGVLVVGRGTIRCVWEERSGRAAHFDVALPGLKLEVTAPPEAGRPSDYAGLVGIVQLKLTTERSSLRLGESVGLRLALRGAGNVWDLPSPFAHLVLDANAEIFAEEPQIDLEAGERLSSRRWDRAVIVPRETGQLVIPPLRVSYYDPRAGEYGLATTEPLVLEVGERPSPSAVADDAAGPPHTARSIAEESFFGPKRRGLRWLAPALAVALLGIGALAWPAYDRRRRRWRPAQRALDHAREALRKPDSREATLALEQSVRAIVRVIDPALTTLSSEEIERRGEGDALLARLAAVLEPLEAARFGARARTGPDQDPSPSLEAVAGLLTAARRQIG
jgi:hypothetical protein